VSGQIAHAMEDAAKKAEQGLAQDFTKAYHSILTDTEQKAKQVAEHAAENETRTVEDLGKSAEHATPEPHEPHGPGDTGRPRSPSQGEEPPLRGDGKPGQQSDGTRKCTKAGDPVDVVSGQMITSAVDLDLPGLLPLVVRRSYASAYRGGRLFGPGWASTLDQRLLIDEQGVHFVGDDAQILHYAHPGEGRAVFPTEGARWPLRWDRQSDTYSIEDPETGWTSHFFPWKDATRTRPITLLTDRNGHRIEYVLDHQGLPREIRHGGGYRVAVDTRHTAFGPRIERLQLLNRGGTGPDRTLVEYRYDFRGRLAEVADPDGRPLVFQHDDQDRITSWRDRNGVWYEYEYGPDGRVARGNGSDGALRAAFEYDDANRVTTVTNSLGQQTRYHYDECFHLARVVDPAGNAVLTEHDRYGRLLSRTDELGHTTRYTLGPHGDVVRIDRADGTAVAIEYDAMRLPTRVQNADGAVWSYTYDGRGNLTSATDPVGASTTYGYDERGHRTSRTDALGQVTSYQTDGAGLEITVTSALGTSVRLERDEFGRIVSTTDPLGGVVRQGWTQDGDLAWREAADGSREEWTYDAERNLTCYRDQAGNRTEYGYGPFDLPTGRTDPDGSRYVFTHDSEMRLVSVTNPQGLVWSYEFDATGCLVSETDFNGRTSRYRSDAAGRLVERVNGAGQRVLLTRDTRGQVMASQTDDGTTTFGYDAVGRLLSASGPGATLEYQRDALGRVLVETIDGRSLTNEYDVLGRRVRRTTATGAVSTWSYDANGLPVSLTNNGGRLSFEHDPAGRETSRGLGGGAALTQSWDPAHRLVGQAVWTPDPSESATGYRCVQSRVYSYRPDGHPVEVLDGLTGTRRYELDPVGRVTAVRAATWTESYAYDQLGNLVHTAHPAVEDTTQGPREFTGTLVRTAGRARYDYDAQGRVIRVTRRTLSGRLQEVGYRWDADDRLVEAVTADGTRWQYRYDPIGRRTAKLRLAADGSVAEETRFTWDAATLAEQWTVTPGAERATTWDWEPGTHRAAAQLDRSWQVETDRVELERRFHAVVTDAGGAPTELVTAEGRIAWRGVRTLWGHVLPDAPVGEGEIDCPLRFPGQYHDAETGLDYNLARYYDAAVAAYLSPDPLGLSAAPNDHAYVDNPLSWIDVLGLKGGKIKRVFDDSEYDKHGSGSGSSAKGEVSRAPKNGQAALDRSIDMDPSNPDVTRRLGVDHENNEIVVLDRHREVTDKEGNVTEFYHGHVQSKYPSKSVTEGDLTKLKRAKMIDNVKKQRVLPPPCQEK
jgi:RHS repeat-associated protein